jgi:hypothetical protein
MQTYKKDVVSLWSSVFLLVGSGPSATFTRIPRLDLTKLA